MLQGRAVTFSVDSSCASQSDLTSVGLLAAGGTPNTSVLARSSSSVNGRVEVMMSHLPEGAPGGGGGPGSGTPKTSFKMPSKKSTIHDLMQVL